MSDIIAIFKAQEFRFEDIFLRVQKWLADKSDKNEQEYNDIISEFESILKNIDDISPGKRFIGKNLEIQQIVKVCENIEKAKNEEKEKFLIVKNIIEEKKSKIDGVSKSI